jgi:AcrR family transcriptional regulator
MAEIDFALVEGVPSVAELARTYDLSPGSIYRHRENHLPARMVAAREYEDGEEADRLRAELDRCFERVNLLFDAVDRGLRDPEDSTRYDVGPRSEEIRVIYTELDADGREVKQKAPLSALLERVKGGPRDRSVIMVEMKHADPRKLLLETAARLQPQIELMGRLIGELQNGTTINVISSPQWIAVQNVIVEALEEHPDARQSVVRALEGVQEGTG